ncbi:hypothetical protein R3P38DRAFT_3201417 [Favolaschia claudopus]|uniref:Uncharacterized protein n=1 Tax=Favolaschia claudopus TaxID=2862362 RepID=A0AAW0AWN2_9AGAR
MSSAHDSESVSTHQSPPILNTLAKSNPVGRSQRSLTQVQTASFIPITPRNHFRRANGDEKGLPDDYTVPPLSRTPVFHPEPVSGWITHEHPGNAVYFRHTDKNIYTDVDLSNRQTLHTISICVEQILQQDKVEGLLQTGDIDLVLAILTQDKRAHGIKCGYYFVDHTERVTFWLEDFPLKKLLTWNGTSATVVRPVNVKLALEMEYWRHVEKFPSALPISSAVLQQLKDLVLFQVANRLATPWGPSELGSGRDAGEILAVIEALAALIEQGLSTSQNKSSVIADPSCGVIIGRFMRECTQFKVQRGILRNAAIESIPISPSAPSLFPVFSILLFGIPARNFTKLTTIHENGDRELDQFVRSLQNEWQQAILFGTLILNVNIAFLALKTVEDDKLAQAFSYASVTFSLGSIFSALLLSPTYHDRAHNLKQGQFEFFFNPRIIRVGYRREASLYALPFALMTWGRVFPSSRQDVAHLFT